MLTRATTSTPICLLVPVVESVSRFTNQHGQLFMRSAMVSVLQRSGMPPTTAATETYRMLGTGGIDRIKHRLRGGAKLPPIGPSWLNQASGLSVKIRKLQGRQESAADSIFFSSDFLVASVKPTGTKFVTRVLAQRHFQFRKVLGATEMEAALNHGKRGVRHHVLHFLNIARRSSVDSRRSAMVSAKVLNAVCRPLEPFKSVGKFGFVFVQKRPTFGSKGVRPKPRPRRGCTCGLQTEAGPAGHPQRRTRSRRAATDRGWDLIGRAVDEFAR